MRLLSAHLVWWSPRALGSHHGRCWGPRALWSLLSQEPAAPRALQAQDALLAVCSILEMRLDTSVFNSLDTAQRAEAGQPSIHLPPRNCRDRMAPDIPDIHWDLLGLHNHAAEQHPLPSLTFTPTQISVAQAFPFCSDPGHSKTTPLAS